MQEKIKKIIKIVIIVFVILTTLAFWIEKGLYFLEDEGDYDYAGFPCYEYGDIGIIEIKGEIVPYLVYASDSEEPENPDSVSSEDVVHCIGKMQREDGIMGVVLEINSYGGSPVASEEIMNAIKRLDKPSVAVIREGAVSGAYLIASATNRIFASEFSDVGGIGITMSYLDYSDKNKKEGVTYQQISAGKFKDTGDPDKPLTAEEKELLMRDIKILHEAFIKNVSQNRKLEIEKVRKLADGSSMLGASAKENGLIDAIGGFKEAENWIMANY